MSTSKASWRTWVRAMISHFPRDAGDYGPPPPLLRDLQPRIELGNHVLRDGRGHVLLGDGERRGSMAQELAGAAMYQRNSVRTRKPSSMTAAPPSRARMFTSWNTRWPSATPNSVLVRFTAMT
jgi:hypothetical protein